MSAAPTPAERPSLCLLPDEVEELTGTPQLALQLQWLDAQRWPYVLNRLGKPKVARAYFEQRMGLRTAANDAGASEPDWTADRRA